MSSKDQKGFAPLSKAARRVSGPLDTGAFGKPLIEWAPAPVKGELSRLSLYRLGLNGTWVKYRVVPRSGIVAFAALAAKVHGDFGDGSLHTVIADLWRDHGAPSRAVIDRYLAEADRIDAMHDDAARSRARRVLLDGWLDECSPRSSVGQLRDNVELGVCWVMRRSRQYTRALAAARK